MVPQDDATLTLPASLAPVIDLTILTRDQVRLVSGFGGAAVIGFDFVAVDVAARWLGIVIDPAMARDLQVIHDEALTVMRAAS